MLVLLAGLVVAVNSSAAVTRLDAEAGGLVRTGMAESATVWSFVITELGGTQAALSLTVIAMAVLAAIRHWHGALAVAAAVLATQATVGLAKVLISRPRPGAGEALIEASGFSFPSGHAATSMALYATLVFLAARACSGAARVAVCMAGALLVLGVGVSRVQLGVHYPTDVLAGWLIGGLVVVAAWALVSRLRAPGTSPGTA